MQGDERACLDAGMNAFLAKPYEIATLARKLREVLSSLVAANGWHVLRFDYYGTGDSALSSERDDIVSQWLESIQHAAAYLRDLSAGDLAIVGLRAGALLACAALPTIGSVGSVALWDPVGRGKTYLREQSALYTMTVGGEKSSVDQPHLVPLIGTTLTSSARTASCRLPSPASG